MSLAPSGADRNNTYFADYFTQLRYRLEYRGGNRGQYHLYRLLKVNTDVKCIVGPTVLPLAHSNGGFSIVSVDQESAEQGRGDRFPWRTNFQQVRSQLHTSNQSFVSATIHSANPSRNEPKPQRSRTRATQPSAGPREATPPVSVSTSLPPYEAEQQGENIYIPTATQHLNAIEANYNALALLPEMSPAIEDLPPEMQSRFRALLRSFLISREQRPGLHWGIAELDSGLRVGGEIRSDMMLPPQYTEE